MRKMLMPEKKFFWGTRKIMIGPKQKFQKRRR